MRKQTVTLTLTVPDDSADPDQVLTDLLLDALATAGDGYSWNLDASTDVTETGQYVGRYADYRVQLSYGDEPVRTPAEARAALTELRRPHAPITGDPDPERGIWVVQLETTDPLVAKVVTQIGDTRIVVPEPSGTDGALPRFIPNHEQYGRLVGAWVQAFTDVMAENAPEDRAAIEAEARERLEDLAVATAEQIAEDPTNSTGWNSDLWDGLIVDLAEDDYAQSAIDAIARRAGELAGVPLPRPHG